MPGKDKKSEESGARESTEDDGSSAFLSLLLTGEPSSFSTPNQIFRTNLSPINSPAFSPTTLLNNLLQGDFSNGNSSLTPPALNDAAVASDKVVDTTSGSEVLMTNEVDQSNETAMSGVAETASSDGGMSFVTAMEDADASTLASNVSIDVMDDLSERSLTARETSNDSSSLRGSPTPFVPSLESVHSMDDVEVTPKRSGRELKPRRVVAGTGTATTAEVENGSVPSESPCQAATDASAKISQILAVPPLESEELSTSLDSLDLKISRLPASSKIEAAEVPTDTLNSFPDLKDSDDVEENPSLLATSSKTDNADLQTRASPPGSCADTAPTQAHVEVRSESQTTPTLQQTPRSNEVVTHSTKRSGGVEPDHEDEQDNIKLDLSVETAAPQNCVKTLHPVTPTQNQVHMDDRQDNAVHENHEQDQLSDADAIDSETSKRIELALCDRDQSQKLTEETTLLEQQGADKREEGGRPAGILIGERAHALHCTDRLVDAHLQNTKSEKEANETTTGEEAVGTNSESKNHDLSVSLVKETKESETVTVNNSSTALDKPGVDLKEQNETTTKLIPPNSAVEIETSDSNDIFRSKSKTKALQVEFPSVLDSGMKKSDVSLSSASSTISGSRRLYGLFNPKHVDDTESRQSNCDQARPRAPAKKQRDNSSPKSFADSLSKKLDSSCIASLEGSEGIESRWIKQSAPKVFNPKMSIFASKQKSEEKSEISPPGSPPEPIYYDSSDSERRSESIRSQKINEANQLDTVTWDMISGYKQTRGLIIEDGRPAFVVMPESDTGFSNTLGSNTDDAGTETSLLTDADRDETKKSNATGKIMSGDTIQSKINKKRRGMTRAQSFTSRGSVRRSLSSGQGSIKSPRQQLKSGKDATVQPTLSKPTSPICISKRPARSAPDLTSLRDHTETDTLIADLSFSLAKLSIIDTAPATDAISPKSLTQMSASAHTEDQTRNGALLEEELMEFSSVKPFNLPFRYSHPLATVKYLGGLRWRQLLACWKHGEMSRAMSVQATSHQVEDISIKRSGDSIDEWSDSTGNCGVPPVSCIILNDVPSKGTRVSESANDVTKNMSECRGSKFGSISRYLSKLGTGWHKSSAILRNENFPAECLIDRLLEAAECDKENLHQLVVKMHEFSLQQSKCDSQESIAATLYSVGLKSTESIQKKADYKYGGDVLQVKDILRARIIFENDAALICGLVYLFRNVATAKEGMTIVRLKNLFESNLGIMVESPLPSGYRHVLLNLRTSTGLLAEIQCNVAPMWNVLGVGGCCLHRELSDFICVSGANDDSFFPVRNVISETLRDNTEAASEKGSLFVRARSKPIQVSLADPQSISKTDDIPEAKQASIESSVQNEIELPINDSEKSENVGGRSGAESVQSDTGHLIDPATLASTALETVIDEPCTQNTVSSERNATFPTEANKKWSSEEVKMHLSVFEKAREGSLHPGDIFLSMLEQGSLSASSSPRDVPTFYCLYILFSHILERENEHTITALGFDVHGKADVADYAQHCLSRCLNISNQATSTGMTGWLEYGRSTHFDRLAERPLLLLRSIAYEFGKQKRWSDAECATHALVTRSEQLLHTCHPVTLTALLDLAIFSSMTGKVALCNNLIERVSQRLSSYLVEVEKSYFCHLAEYKSSLKPGSAFFYIDEEHDSIFKLQAFVSVFHANLDRGIVKVASKTNGVLLLNHCFLADAAAVLANCKNAARLVVGAKSDATSAEQKQEWHFAYAHYNHSFKAFLASRELDDPLVVRAAYGLSRCLHEFGETEKALELLKTTVAFSTRNEQDCVTHTEALPVPHVASTYADDDAKENHIVEQRFFPKSIQSNGKEIALNASKHTSLALCFWLMSILSLEKSSNYEGRDAAFGYLHAASISLQTALSRAGFRETCDTKTRDTYNQFLTIIENEAAELTEPKYDD